MIEITKTEKQVKVVSPYNPEFPKKARRLDGEWIAPAWVFDVRDEQRVRDLCIEIYGTDGSSADLVTLRCEVGDDGWDAHRAGLFLAGRQVARATGRDSGATTGDGVIVLAGQFRSGGSMKNWRTIAEPNTVFELRDIPKVAADKAIEQAEDLSITIIDSLVDIAGLQREREQLVTRIAEIDQILSDQQ